MADDVTVDNGGLTDYIVATDEDAGDSSHYQLIKLAYGALGTFTLVESGVGLPVAVQGSIPVTDGGGSLTVDGTVGISGNVTVIDGGGSLTVDGTVAVTDGGGSITVDGTVGVSGNVTIIDGGGSITVDGAVTVSGTVDTELPAAAALADNTANPTVPAVGTFGHVWDGTNWDRQPGDNNGTWVAGKAALDAAVVGNPVLVGGRASTATPTAVSADGDAVWLWLDRSGGLIINGRDAHDAALNANTNPALVGARASAAAPTDVSADGDAVRLWALRSGALATVLTAAGALIGGDATNGLDVDVTRVQGTVTVGATDLDIRNLDVAQDDVRVGGMAAHDAAVADNPVATGGRASDAVPTAVSADGDAVWAWMDRRGAAKVVMVDDAGDSAMDGTNNALRVNVVAGSGGATQYAEDTASAAGESVIMVGVVRKDSAASLVDADNDRTELQVDASGALRVTGGGGGTEYTEDVASPGDPVGNAQMLRRRDTPASEVTTAGDWIAQNATQYGAGYVQILTSAGAFVDSFGGGTQYTEDAAAPANPTGTALALVRDDALSGQVDTDGDILAARGTNNGELYVKHVDSIPVTDGGGSLTVDGTVAISGTVTVDSELPAALALAEDMANPTAPAVGAFLMGLEGSTWDRILATSGSLSVDLARFDGVELNAATGLPIGDGTFAVEVLASGADNLGNTTNELVTAALGYVYDGTAWDRLRGDSVGGAFAQGPVAADGAAAGNPLYAGGRASAAAPTDVSADGDVVPLWLLRSGAQATALTAAGALIGGDATNGLDVDVTRVQGSVTVAQATAANLLATVTQGPAGTAWEVIGDVAHDAAAPANPVVVGAQMETPADSAPGTRAGTDGDAVKLASIDGAIYVAGRAPQASHTHFDSTSTLQTDGTIKAAPGAGLSIYVTDIVFSIGAATASSIFFEEGSTKVLGPYYLEAIAGRGLAIAFQTPKKITANTALTVTNTGSTTYAIDVGWFVAPG